MGKVAKDKWDKVIEYLTYPDRDPQKVLSLLKGCDQGNQSNYDINRASYSLNIIAIVTQKQLDPENKDKTLTHIIRHWVKSKDFIQFYNIMKKLSSKPSREGSSPIASRSSRTARSARSWSTVRSDEMTSSETIVLSADMA